MKKYGLVALALVFAISLLAGMTTNTANAGWKDKLNKKGGKEKKEITYPPYTGPKKRIAIYRFVDKVKSPQSKMIGDPMLEQLSEELHKTNRFIVLVRGEDLDDIDDETMLGMSGRVKEGQETASDQLMGAQAIFKGAITEFSLAGKKDSGGIKLPGSFTGGVGIKLGGGKQKAIVKITLKMIDPASGAVVWQDSATGEAVKSGGALGLDYKGAEIDLAKSKDTPLGAATLMAIRKAVLKIIAQMDGIPWQASILKVTGNKVIIRAGKDSGIKPGDILDLYQKGEVLEDPDTGEKLRMDPEKIGSVQVTKVQTKMSVCIVKSGKAKRGGLVMMP